MQQVAFDGTFGGWRDAVRPLVVAGVEPSSLVFSTGDEPQTHLFAGELDPPTPSARELRVPGEFVSVARTASFHRDPSRWSLAYRILWRISRGERALMALRGDDQVARLIAMHKEVRRDAHKMKAFVRFKRIEDDDGHHFVAWHRSDHLIVPFVAPFFADRFSDMRWTIMTPDASVSWDRDQLRFGAGTPRREAPAVDELEDLWREYYRSIFNPARIKLDAMQAEMPKKHWQTMPEADIIRDLLREAPARIAEMKRRQHQVAEVPEADSLSSLREAASSCEACGICEFATQTVFGEGPVTASLMLVGEQPGDREDLSGRPFVGPAGGVLDQAFRAANVERSSVYLTNAVKHFKNEERGKRRIHKRPEAYEVEVCRPWLTAEFGLVKPKVVVALGGTAALSILGRKVKVTEERGIPQHAGRANATAVVTYHPAAILRTPEGPARDERFAALVDDLRFARGLLSG